MDSRQITDASVSKFLLGYDTTTHRLTIPYLTPAGPFSVKYRCLRDHDCKENGHGKYMYDAGTPIHLFNAAALVSADIAVVVEGELDAVAVDQLGLAAVGYPGTAMWKANPHWRWCFDSLSEVIVVADGDDQGKAAAGRVAESLRTSVSADVRVVELPAGEDSNSYINLFGETDYLERLDLL